MTNLEPFGGNACDECCGRFTESDPPVIEGERAYHAECLAEYED